MPFPGTQWPRSASNALNPAHGCRGRLHGSAHFRICLQSTNATPLARVDGAKATRSSTVGRVSSTIGYSHEEPNVDPDSLRNTLEAHREANRASMIVKIAGKGLGRQTIQIPSLVERKGRPTVSQVQASQVWRPELQFARANERNGKRKGNRRERQRLAPVQFAGEKFLAQWAPSPKQRYSERYPWMKHMQPALGPQAEGRLAAIEQLGKEIDAFYWYSKPTLQETTAVQRALHDISTAIKEADQSIEIEVIGSRATGLDLPLSDIDLNVSIASTSTGKWYPQGLLRGIARYLEKSAQKGGSLRSLVYRLRPRVQLVTVRHVPTYLEFQVQSTVDAFLSMQQTISFVNEFPTLRKLFVVLKQMLTMRGLNRGEERGLSSYPLLVMIVAALKFSEGKLDRRDIGGHLLFFLDMYSGIDFTTTAISFSPLQYVVKRHPHSSTLPHVRSAAPAPDSSPEDRNELDCEAQDMNARRRFATIKPDAEWLMCLQDPANLQNDLGKAAYRIREVQSAFVRVRKKLKADLKAWEDSEVNGNRTPLLASCVGGDYRIYEHMRHDLRGSIDVMSKNS